MKLSEELLDIESRLREISKDTGLELCINVFPQEHGYAEVSILVVTDTGKGISFIRNSGLTRDSNGEVAYPATGCIRDNHMTFREMDITAEEWAECVDQIGGREE